MDDNLELYVVEWADKAKANWISVCTGLEEVARVEKALREQRLYPKSWRLWVADLREREKVSVACRNPECGVQRTISRSMKTRIERGESPGLCYSCGMKAYYDSKGKVNNGPPCRHCKVKVASRGRGLCWRCYSTPGVLELYPPTSKYAKRGVRNFAGAAPLADEPTTEAPGTEGKMVVMGERAEAGRAIFHPADARYEGDLLPLKFLEKRAAGVSFTKVAA